MWLHPSREFLPHSFEERRNPFAGRGRHSVKRNASVLQMRAQRLEPRRIVERVDLVRGDDHRLVAQPFPGRVAAGEQLQLPGDYVEIRHRIAAACRGYVDHVNEHFRALEMAQETMT